MLLYRRSSTSLLPVGRSLLQALRNDSLHPVNIRMHWCKDEQRNAKFNFFITGNCSLIYRSSCSIVYVPNNALRPEVIWIFSRYLGQWNPKQRQWRVWRQSALSFWNNADHRPQYLAANGQQTRTCARHRLLSSNCIEFWNFMRERPCTWFLSKSGLQQVSTSLGKRGWGNRDWAFNIWSPTVEVHRQKH